MQGDTIRIFRNLIQLKNEYLKAVNIIESSEYNYVGGLDDKLKELLVKLIKAYSGRLIQKESTEFSTSDYDIYEDFIKNTMLDFASYIISKGIEDESYNHCIKSYYQTRRNRSYQTRYAVSVSNSKRGHSLEYCIEQYLSTPPTSNKHKNTARRLKQLLSTDLNGVKRYIDSLNKKKDESNICS